MDEKTFRGFLSNLHAIFDRKMPPEPTYLAWWDELRFIPNEAISSILVDLKDLESWPRNFPVTVKNFWKNWLDRTPGKKIVESVGCGLCGKGFWTLSKFVEGYYWATFAIQCPYCNEGSRKEHELIEAGFCKPHSTASEPYHKNFPDHGYVRPEPSPGNITIDDLPF